MALVERENDLQVLDKAYAACVHGRERLVIISGNMGCGKTELLRTFAERAIGQGAALISATGSASEQSLRFGVLGQLIQSPALSYATDFNEEFLGVADSNSIGDGFRSPYILLNNVCTALRDLAKKHPVVIAVDDIEFADEPSLHALLYLRRRLQFARVLFILTELSTPHRRVFDAFHAEITRQGNTSRRRLAPLSSSGVARLLETRLDPASAQTLAAACHRLTGGNPLLVNALIEDHCAARSAGSDPPIDGEPCVGQEFAHAVVTCLSRGERSVLEVARAIAVLDHASSPALLSELLDVGPVPIRQVLDTLEAAGVIAGGRFRHPIARDAVLEGLHPADQGALYLRAAQVLYGHDAKAAEVARYLVVADGFGAMADWSWGVNVLRCAAQEDLAAGQIDEAAHTLSLAASRSQDDTERAEVTSLLLRVEWLRRPSAAARYLDHLRAARAASRLSNDDALYLAKFLLWFGQVDELAATLAAIAAPAPGGPANGDYHSLAVHWIAFLCPPAAQSLAPLRVTGRSAVPGNEWGYAVQMLDRVRAGESAEEIVISAEHILRSCRLGEQTFDLHVCALVALLCVDSNERAEYWCETLVADAGTLHMLAWQAILGSLYAMALIRRGELTRAAKNARAAYDLLSPQGWGVVIGLPLAARVAAATRMGRYDEAAALLCLPVPEAMFQTQFGLFYLYERGLHYLVTDHVSSALEDFQRCGELMRAWQIDLPAAVPWRVGVAEAHIALGNVETARAMARDQLRHPSLGAGRTRGIALRTLGVVSDPCQRVQLLQESADLLENSGDPFESARSSLQLSRTFSWLGDPEKSRAAAQRATRLASRCQAETLICNLLPGSDVGIPVPDSAGIPPKRISNPLSDAERKVAELAALGHSNKEIGATLFITVSTVEQHLTHVYRKLQLKNRAALPNYLQQYASDSPGNSLPCVTRRPATLEARH